MKEGVQFWEKVNVNGNNCQFARKEAAAFTANFGSRSSLIQTSAVSLASPGSPPWDPEPQIHHNIFC